MNRFSLGVSLRFSVISFPLVYMNKLWMIGIHDIYSHNFTLDSIIHIEIPYLEEKDDWGVVKGKRTPFFSDFDIRYNTDVPATPPTSANKMRRSGVILSNPVGGGGGVGLITRITLKYL